MNLRQTVYLLALLAILIGLYIGMQYRREHRDQQVQEAKRIFAFAPGGVRRVSIERLGEAASVAERVSETAWRIVEPNETILPFHRMWTRVTENLAGLMNEHTVLESPQDLAPYGLDAPALKVQAALEDGSELSLRFGDLEPTQRYRYAQLDGGALFLVSTDMFFELNRSLYDLRHRYLVQEREAPIMRMEFAWIWTEAPAERGGRVIETGQESVTIVVERDGLDAPWRVVAPFEALARYEAVQALANELQFAVCSEFIDAPEDLSDYGLQPARARITFQTADDSARQTVWMGAVDESPDRQGLFTKTEGQDAIQITDGHLLALLPASPVEWRDLRLLTRRISDIRELVYTAGGDQFVLGKQEEGAWRLLKPELEATNEFAVNGFLRFIKEVEGDEFVEDEDVLGRFEDPEVTIALRFDDDASATIRLVPDPDDPDTYYALQDSGGVVSISGVAVNMLLITSDAFRSLELLRFTRTDVSDIALTFEGNACEISRRHDQWVAIAPEGLEIRNQADVDTLLGAVTPLHALGLAYGKEDDASDARYGLEEPVFSLRLQMNRPEGQELTLDIGAVNAENPSERYARSSMRTGVFRISQEVMDEIREALRGIL